jgi:hypothetical protein
MPENRIRQWFEKREPEVQTEAENRFQSLRRVGEGSFGEVSRMLA